MTKAKPKPKRMHERIEQTWIKHPLISLSSIVGVLTIISLLAPGVLWAINHFQTADEGKRLDAEVRAIIIAHQVNDARTNAWQSLQAIKNEQVALRNRVNDCDIKLDKRDLMSPLERSACLQYKQEFDDASKRYNEARSTAMATTKEK